MYSVVLRSNTGCLACTILVYFVTNKRCTYVGLFLLGIALSSYGEVVLHSPLCHSSKLTLLSALYMHLFLRAQVTHQILIPFVL